MRVSNYPPQKYGYACHAMMRFRPENADSKRIEIYPKSQWGDMGVEYTGPENADLTTARADIQRQKRKST